MFRLKWRAAAALKLATVGRIAFAIAIGTFAFRLLDARFHNEHIELMSGGRQIVVYGELPFRDWLDPGRFLSYFLSAGVQLLFGYNMLGEALMTSALVAIAAGLTFLLAARASGSVAVALWVTGLSILIYPRLYNYYKIVLPILGIYLCWRYADKRDWLGLAVLGMATGVGALTRQDFGVYLGLAAGMTLLLLHRRDGIAHLAVRTAAYLTALALTLLPFLVFLEANGGVLAYYAAALDFGQREKDVLTDLLAFSGPAIALGAVSLELPIVGSIVLPSPFQASNASAWLFYLFGSLPLIALVALVTKLFRQHPVIGMPCEVSKMAAAIVLSAVAIRVLMPHASLSRLADVGPLAAVLGAWLIGQFVGDPLRRWQARVRLGVVALVALVTTFSVATIIYAEYRGDSRFGRPITLLRRAPETLTDLATSPPIEAWSKSGSGGLRAAVRYLRDCTGPTDRVFVTAYRPEVVFYSGRAFAGGVPFILRDHFSSEATQEQIIQRLKAQPVPIVIAEARGFEDGEFSKRHTLIHNYLASRHDVGGASTFGDRGGETYLVLVDPSRAPTGTYEPYSLPCFR